MTDLLVDSGNHRVKGLGGNYTNSLDLKLSNAHMLSFTIFVVSA
jgi:hypothetical protein